MTRKIDSLISGDLLCENAWATTQFYRGELFTFVDCILTEDFSTAEEEENALKFLEKTMELII